MKFPDWQDRIMQHLALDMLAAGATMDDIAEASAMRETLVAAIRGEPALDLAPFAEPRPVLRVVGGKEA